MILLWLTGSAGYVPAYVALDTTGKEAIITKNTWPGLKQGEEMMRWLWKQQFAAVASDAPAFECVRECSPTQLLPSILASQHSPALLPLHLAVERRHTYSSRVPDCLKRSSR